MNPKHPVTRLTIGMAMETIPFTEGSVLSGYPNPDKRRARGTFDPLEVDALLLNDGHVTALLLSADVLGLGREEVQRAKKRIAERIAIPEEQIFICCTHTHSSGLGTQLKGDSSLDVAFVDQVLDALVRVAERARTNLVPTTVRVASGEAALGHNRRVVKNGLATNVWNDPGKRHTGPVDKEVGAVLFLDDQDHIRAMILNYSCHPVTLGPGSHYASADFPGYARTELRHSLGEIPIVYTTGAAGDINPYDGLREEPSMASEMGKALAWAVQGALPEAVKIPDPQLACHHQAATFIRKKDNQEILTEFQLLTIGQELAFLTLPGEPLVEIGLKLKSRSRFPHTFILGYTNDYLSYLVTRKAVKEGGYEASLSFNDEIEDAILDLGKVWL